MSDTDGAPGAPAAEEVPTVDPLAGAAEQVADDLGAISEEVAGFGQSTEEAVAEAVDMAQRFEAERDELRELVQRVQADFENYRRRVDAQQVEQRERAAEDLVRDLLPVLDTCAAAVAQGHDQVAPVRDQLMAILVGKGLAEVVSDSVPFDPNVHEAVLHEESSGDLDGPVVAEVMRAGYLWHERVLRPAMVRVRG